MSIKLTFVKALKYTRGLGSRFLNIGKQVVSKVGMRSAGIIAGVTFAVGWGLNKSGFADKINGIIHNPTWSSVIIGVMSAAIVGGVIVAFSQIAIPVVLTGVLIGGIGTGLYTYNQFKGKGPGLTNKGIYKVGKEKTVKHKGNKLKEKIKKNVVKKAKIKVLEDGSRYLVKMFFDDKVIVREFNNEIEVKKYIMEEFEKYNFKHISIEKNSPSYILEWLISYLNSKRIVPSFYELNTVNRLDKDIEEATDDN